MSARESWQNAYRRIFREVEAEMADAPEAERFEAYQSRCRQLRAERGTPLDPYPWTNPRGGRHSGNALHGCVFDPRPGYSQNREDYE